MPASGGAVRDLDRTEAMLTAVLHARKVYDSGPATFSISRERFFLIGDVWVAVMEGDPLPSRTYNHVAFRICVAPAVVLCLNPIEMLFEKGSHGGSAGGAGGRGSLSVTCRRGCGFRWWVEPRRSGPWACVA